MTAIALLGIGRMGSAMAGRLLDANHDLTVWNRTPQRAEPLVAAGARAATSPADAARGADVVTTMLTDETALREVVLGPEGVVEGIQAGGCLVDMSTVGPDAIRSIAGELPSGVGVVDAPVSGSVGQAADGTLAVLAGGDATDVDTVQPVLASFGDVRRCGALGMGAAAKLVAISTRIAAMALLGEAKTVGASLGVPADLTTELLSDSPLGTTLGRAEQPGAHYALALAAKDVRLALNASESTSLPLTTTVLDRVTTTINDVGPDRDIRTLADPVAAAGGPEFVRISDPEGVPPPVGPFSHLARLELGAGTLLVLSGQIAVDDAGDLVGEGDIAAQSRQIFTIVEGILASQGATFADVVNIRTFMTDLGQLPGYAAVRREYFPSTSPTSTTVEIPRLFRAGALLEVEVTAAVGR